MTLKLLSSILVGLVLFGPAEAQTASQDTIGYMSTSCGSAASPCFIQYGSTVPVTGTTTTTPLAAASTPDDNMITVGGTFQTLAALSTSRKSLDFVNVCNVVGNCTTTGNYCYLYMAASGSPSTANSVPVQPGQEYLRSNGAIPSDAIQATCDGTGDHFALKVQ